MSEKLTEWFEPSVKPELIGVYQTRGGMAGNTKTFQHWNGRYWGVWCASVAHAACEARCKSIRQNPEWRGLAENPEK